MIRILAAIALGMLLAGCAYYGSAPGYAYGPGYYGYYGYDGGYPGATSTERALPNGAFGG
jgi:hypothetical protein